MVKVIQSIGTKYAYFKGFQLHVLEECRIFWFVFFLKFFTKSNFVPDFTLFVILLFFYNLL